MSLLEKLKAGTKNVKVIDWPGTEDKVGISILTEAETQEAAFDTERLFKKHGIEYSFAVSDAYQAERNTQTLVRALVDPDKRDPKGNPVRLFKNADELRPSPGFVLAKADLIDEFNAWDEECNPSAKTLTEKEYQELFEEVKKNPSILSDLSLRTLRGLIIYSANRPATSPTDSGSSSG